MENINVFEENAHKYDQWFDENAHAYESQLLALKRFIPPVGKGIEIGVDTGRFAAPLGIRVGVEPAKEMVEAARICSDGDKNLLSRKFRQRYDHETLPLS